MLVEEENIDNLKDQQKEQRLQPNIKDIQNDESISELGRKIRKIAMAINNRWYFNCLICLEQFQNQECCSYSNCEHQRNFCTSCLVKYVKFKLIFFEEIKCPKEGCTASMNIESAFFKNLPSSIQKRYRKISQYYEKLHDANFRTCPSESCEGNIVYKGNAFACTLCKENFCLNCLAKEHEGECYMQEIAFFKNILHFRRCPCCKFIIEKKDGCNHMTCICKYEFCYLCNDTYTRLHSCQYDSNHNVIIKNPIITIDNKKVLKDEGISTNSRLSESIFLAFSLLVILIPLLMIRFVAFLIWVSFLALLNILKISLITLIIAILGAGPYAYQYSKDSQMKIILFLTICYPFTLILSLHRGFKELFAFIVYPIIQRYQKTVEKCWKIACVNFLSE